MPVGGEAITSRFKEVHPPQREEKHQAGCRDQHEHARDPASIQCGRHPDRRRQHAFAEEDDREQPVAFGDVMRMPRGAAPTFRPSRNQQLSHHEDEEGGQQPVSGHQFGGAEQPPDLDQADPGGVAKRGTSASRMLPGGTQPLRDEADTHQEVAERDGQEVPIVEGGRHAGGKQKDTGHLHHGEQPVRDIVGVVRRREPGEVHPRPPDSEEDLKERQRNLPGVPLGDAMGELAGDAGNSDDEGEVEE